MNLLFKREQTVGSFRRVKFKLWGKVEFDDDEKEIIKRYRMSSAMLIVVDQPTLFRKSVFVTAVVFIFALTLAGVYVEHTYAGPGGALLLGAIVGYIYYHQNRETIYVRDLMHGRHFTCNSVIELARKEAWLELVTSFLRQVMESAKHWDGTQRHAIDPLPKDEARQVIIKGL